MLMLISGVLLLTNIDKENARVIFYERRESVRKIKERIPGKNLKDLSVCEKKLLTGMECTNEELGI